MRASVLLVFDQPVRSRRSRAAIQCLPPSNFIIFFKFQYIHCIERKDERGETGLTQVNPGDKPHALVIIRANSP